MGCVPNNKVAYFNCLSGISGDMLISSLINSGLIKPEELETNLKAKLQLKSGWSLKIRNQMFESKNQHIPVTQLKVISKLYFSANQMLKIIKLSRFPYSVKKTSFEILSLLMQAESKIHKVPKNKVHFHELSHIDTLIDILGILWCLHKLNIKKVFCSPINIGKPAPATLEILRRKKFVTYSTTPKFELTTPTGAAIISVIARSKPGAGPVIMPLMKIDSYGYAIGTRNYPSHTLFPLQLIVGTQV